MTARNVTAWKKYTFALLCFFIVAVVFIATNSMIQAKGAENQEITERVAALTAERNRLLAEQAALSSPQRIESLAATSLGMVKATEERRVYYQDTTAKTAKETKTTTE